MNKDVAILILFFNKLSETVECIESFIPSQQHIYVLNNGSDDGLWKQLKHRFDNNSQITLFHSNSNLGIPIGRNYLIKNSTEPWVMIVDNDITAKFPKDWIKSFKQLLLDSPNFDVFTLRIYNVHEKAYVKPIKIVKTDRAISIETTKDNITNCFPCTGSVINRNVFRTNGLLDEDLFVFEDYEYGIRCMHSEKGELKVYQADNIELVHDHRFQKTKVDKLAVRERYREERIRQSQQHIAEKYNIEFEHSWEWWTKKQVAEMAGKSVLGRIKAALIKYAGLARGK